MKLISTHRKRFFSLLLKMGLVALVFVIAFLLIQLISLRSTDDALFAWRSKQGVPDRIEIIVKNQYLHKLRVKRDEALKTGILLATPDDYVPAKIKYKGRMIDARIRLKGDLTDHFEDEKWSFRVRLTKDRAFFGMRKFSIQHPRTRNYLAEWFIQKVKAKEGLMEIKLEFVDFYLNGKYLGVFTLEEHFDQLLLAHNRLREGVIVSFDEDLIWRNKLHYIHDPNIPMDHFKMSKVRVYDQKKVLHDSELARQFEVAQQYLDGLRSREYTLSDVFDVKKMATYLAMLDLYGGHHGILMTNLKLYYDPIAARLWPIGFDHDGLFLNSNIIGEEWAVLRNAFPGTSAKVFDIFGDREFSREYIQELERMSDMTYLKEILSSLETGLEHNYQLILKDNPDYKFPIENIRKNAQMIQGRLNPPHAIEAVLESSRGKTIKLKMANRHTLPVEVLGLVWQGRVVSKKEVYMADRAYFDRPVFASYEFQTDQPLNINTRDAGFLKIKYHVYGATAVNEVAVKMEGEKGPLVIAESFHWPEKPALRHEFLLLDETRKEIVFKPGLWMVDRDVVIPAGYKVRARGGVKLDLRAGAKLVSYSELDFFAPDDDPIVLFSSDRAGEGLVLLNAASVSRLQGVVFRGLHAAVVPGSMAAVVVEGSDIKLNHVNFEGIYQGSGLLVRNAEFEILNTDFSGVEGNALVVSKSQGTLTDCEFFNVARKGVVVASSIMNISNARIEQAGDTGIAITDDSRVMVDNTRIAKTDIGLLSRDLAETYLEHLMIEDVNIGLAVYQKTETLGPSMVLARDVRIDRPEIYKYLIGGGSMLAVDGVKKVMNPGEMHEKNIIELRRRD